MLKQIMPYKTNNISVGYFCHEIIAKIYIAYLPKLTLQKSAVYWLYLPWISTKETPRVLRKIQSFSKNDSFELISILNVV